MEEVKERTNKQTHNSAKMRPASVFLQPVRENLVSFAQQTKEANFISKKMLFLFCFSEKGNVLCTKFLFLQKSAQMQQLLQFP